MRLRQAMQQRDPDGPVERVIRYLSIHGFTAFDALMVPFMWLFAAIMLATSAQAIHASPVYGRLVDLAPIEAWAILLATLATLVVLSISCQWWYLARLSYVLLATWWFAIGGLVYLASTTLLSPAVYCLIAFVCLYRQAEIAVGYDDGGD